VILDVSAAAVIALELGDRAGLVCEDRLEAMPVTGKNGRQSRMVLRVVLGFDGERVELDRYESPGERLPSIKDTIYIPAGGTLYIYLDVWVAGKKDEPIGLEFWEEEGEVIY
jgi:hypothetical protein